MKTVALLIFIAVYVLLLLLPNYRAISALAAAAVFVLLGIVPLGEIAGAVDWNVLLMLAGTMGTVDLFIRSNMPNRLSDRLAALLPGPAQERHRRRGRLCRRPSLVLPGGGGSDRERPRRQRRRRHCGGRRKDHQPRYVRGRSPAADAGTGGI